ncbi:restriction endonuclease-related protein [Streptosporangium sandarakinum]|uniref:restriction endonuclease-related protein n=1 Tax=Streptosporangium sandarakinum TaxID=1260955 RepID=UPI003691B17A
MRITQYAATPPRGRTGSQPGEAAPPADTPPAAEVPEPHGGELGGQGDSDSAAQDYLTVELLCAALARIRMNRQRAGGHGQPAEGAGPLPRAWRDARGRLWWKAQKQELDWPKDDLELFSWCRRPLRSWPVPLRLVDGDLDAVLLEGDELSEFAEQAADLARHADVEAELVQNQTFEALMSCARMNGDTEEEVQRAYCRLRRLLIDRPVLSDRDVQSLVRELPRADADNDSFAAKFIRTAYVHHPIEAPGVARLRRCRECRNPVDAGAAGCGTSGCEGTPERYEVACLGGYWTQHRATRQFFHDPGLLEGRLLDRLAELPTERVRIQAWPCLDAWDAAVMFEPLRPGQEKECWVIDAKDCSSPALLARGFRSDPRVPARRRIIVVPMHRRKMPGYVADLERELQGRVTGVEVLDEQAFVRQAAARAGRAGAAR